jgi:hypothetical protein
MKPIKSLDNCKILEQGEMCYIEGIGKVKYVRHRNSKVSQRLIKERPLFIDQKGTLITLNKIKPNGNYQAVFHYGGLL